MSMFKEVVRGILSKINQQEVYLTDATNLFDAGVLDSFGVLSLIAALEKKFQLSVPAEKLTMENFMTVDSIACLLEELQVLIV